MKRILTDQELEHLKTFHKYAQLPAPAGKRLDLAISAAVTGAMGYSSRQHASRIKRTLQAMGYINEAGTRVTAKGVKYLTTQ